MKIDNNNDEGAAASDTAPSCNILQPKPGMMLKLNTTDTDVNFLYNPEFQVNIATKRVYDSSKGKPLPQGNKSGTGVDGSTFKLD